MRLYFNISGPCNPDEHYMLPAQERCQYLLDLIRNKQYFVIHAARQSGKTTLLKDLTRQLNQSNEYYTLYCSLETVDQISKVEVAMPVILSSLQKALKHASWNKGHLQLVDFEGSMVPSMVLEESLIELCKELDKPLVVLFDEVDCLEGRTLVSFLRQLRDGYINRDEIPFVHSIGLVGMRDIRDLRLRVRPESETLGSASPFNIVAESMTLRNFTQEEVRRLYAQHTEATGQVFADGSVERAFYWSQGQPWLVNALARQSIIHLLNNDFKQTIDANLINQAAEALIQRRDTHLDSLLKRLKEPRVRKVIEPILLGQTGKLSRLSDDFAYVQDLGLIRRAEDKTVRPGNAIYTEVIARTLSCDSQEDFQSSEIGHDVPFYIKEGKFDMMALLKEFQGFWRKNSEVWIERYEYKEAAPHLILQAYLQRVFNGGGQIEREFAAGRGRVDLCVRYKNQLYPIELKLRYDDETYTEGISQLSRYMQRLGCTEGWLLVFDRRPETEIPWSKKIFWREEQIATHTIAVVGC